MSTVKIKTEPPTTAATAAAATVDVKVKLEPSLSTTTDIKLEQHTSDIETKFEPGSEEDFIKSEYSDDDGDTDQTTAVPKNQRKPKCDYPGCDRRFNSSSHIRMHQFDHRLQVELNIHGETYILARQSLDDRWQCPIPDCTSTAKTVDAVRSHIRRIHANVVRQQQLKQQAQSQGHLARRKYHFIDVDYFYVNGVRCGYHNTIGLFMCYKCRLVPDCLRTHLQQKHGFDEKSIDNSALPGSAVTAGADPNINQHTNNSHLASAIKQPYQQHHHDIIQGWLCVTSECGCCGYTARNQGNHKRNHHQGEQILTAPALILRLAYSKSSSSYFFITRIDQASGAVTTCRSRINQHKLDYSHNQVNTHEDENGDDDNHNETIEESNQKRQFVCDHDNCGLLFNSARQLSIHRREHKLEVAINVQGETFTLTRQSADDRWACPVPGCTSTWKTIITIHTHIQNTHLTSTKQKRVKSEDDDSCQQQQPVIKRRQQTRLYLKVDDFYISGTKCGYHTTTELFICHECKLVPECLLTHLQQKHGYSEKSIDSAFLPESARTSESDPNINQHTSNSHLAAAIREPSQLHHQDIVQGWLCATSDCGYCGYTVHSKYNHKKYTHRSEQISTVPALVLRLFYAKAQASCFLITRLGTTIASVNTSDSMNQRDRECDEDDGDELVLSDYSDENDIH